MKGPDRARTAEWLASLHAVAAAPSGEAFMLGLLKRCGYGAPSHPDQAACALSNLAASLLHDLAETDPKLASQLHAKALGWL